MPTASSTFHSIWLGGKKYSRQTYADGSREYAVYAGSVGFETGGHWQKLAARCKPMMTKIDAALAAMNQKGK